MHVQTLTLGQMRANVTRSREHVARQEATIGRLMARGHDDVVAIAREVLTAMRQHLETEIEMLRDMEAMAGGSSD